MNTLSNDPYLYFIDNFLTSEECNFIINISKNNMKLAGVVYEDNEKHKFKIGEYKGRTNSSYWLSHDKYPELLLVEEKKPEQNVLPSLSNTEGKNIITRFL